MTVNAVSNEIFCGSIHATSKRIWAILCSLTAAGLIIGCGGHRPAVNPPASTPSPATEAPEAQPPSTVARPPVMGPPATSTSTTPAEFTERGVAWWYGAPFNGRRTSDGETYNMFQATAAHRTLPFGALVRVTNLNNGRKTVVRINDRGPFVANRIIDLSYAAAEAIGMIGTGTAPVRLDLVGGPNPAGGYFGVQVGAFQVEENAARLRQDLETQYSPVTIATVKLPSGTFYRVRVGRTANEELAQELAQRIEKEEQMTVFVVRLDD